MTSEQKAPPFPPAAGCADTGPQTTNFIRQIINEDVESGKVKQTVTRFPPEPNGFLHLGHAKSICLNFGIARDYNGICNLRFDDTNPTKEDQRYIDSIIEDVRWLGGNWENRPFYASDYFQQLHDWAVLLIQKGLAYVDDQTEEEVKKNRGDVTTPGTNSPFRDRSVEENLDLFAKMKAGDFAEGHCILRAKIDMTNGNMHMRDPPLYRIKKDTHPRTGDKWVIYPFYDFAHGESDSIEKITHSICTLEFEDHRPLYEWFQENLGIFRTRQIEFARLNLSHTVMSKRKLLTLVQEKYVEDWDDPRMPTLSGLRRRGYPAAAIRDFCERVGVAKRDNVIELSYFETCVREHLHSTAMRRYAVIRPIKVVVTNWTTDPEALEVPNHPTDASFGVRQLKFGRDLYIDAEDFQEQPAKEFHRLAPGKEVRLRYAYWVKCEEVVKDADGQIVELRVTYDPETKGGFAPPCGRKVKGTIHWLGAEDCHKAVFRLYDRLFLSKAPEEPPPGETTGDWRKNINPKSLEDVTGFVETAGLETKIGEVVQFERLGFFCKDPKSEQAMPVFGRTVELTDTYAAASDATSKEAKAKVDAKEAREKAAMERQKKKEDRERRQKEKEEAKAKAA